MGQKTNPIILRLDSVKQYKHKYIEKKSQEESLYNFESLQIKKFIFDFFKKNQISIHNYKIHYSNDNMLQIFLTYHPKNEFNFLIKETKTIYPKVKYNYVLKKNNNYTTDLKVNSKTNKLLKQFLTGLQIFLKKRTRIRLVISQLNKKNILNLEEIKLIKKKFVKLKNYEQNKFYKKSLIDSFLFLHNYSSASILASLIAFELSKLKRHNFFLRFLKKVLVLLKLNSLLSVKGIQILIKGRINGVPRAKQKTIIIGKKIPTISISTNIDYSEKVSYTSNGTLGVKVWTF